MLECGKFIVFEGVDGSGVTTHASRLKDWLYKQRIHVHYSAEPTDSPIGAVIKWVLKSYWNVPKRPDLLGLLYAADRLYHVNYETFGHSGGGLHDAMKKGYVVIYSRYILSSLAYQGVYNEKVEVSEEWLKTINNFGIGLPAPDLTIFLDVPPEKSLDRIRNQRDRFELFENTNDLERVYNRYKELIKDPIHNVVQISEMKNGKEKTIDEVQTEIRRLVMDLLEGTTKTQNRRNKKNAKVSTFMRDKT